MDSQAINNSRYFIYTLQIFSIFWCMYFAFNFDILDTAVQGRKFTLNDSIDIYSLDKQSTKNKYIYFADTNSSYICCYTDPMNRTNIGRPFLRTEFVDKYYGAYVSSDNTITPWQKNNLTQPALVTALSMNHYVEHLAHYPSIRRHFPGQKIIVYDLGLCMGVREYYDKKESCIKVAFINENPQTRLPHQSSKPKTSRNYHKFTPTVNST